MVDEPGRSANLQVLQDNTAIARPTFYFLLQEQRTRIRKVPNKFTDLKTQSDRAC